MEVSDFNNKYGHQVRTRVCGLLIQGNEVLLVKHKPLGPKGYLWSPPGGKVDYGSSLKENLQREFKEETNLIVQTGAFRFINEYRVAPIHAIEIFFEVKLLSGSLALGRDPELPAENQLIKDVAFKPFDWIKKQDPSTVHNMFRYCSNIRDLHIIAGFFKFGNI